MKIKNRRPLLRYVRFFGALFLLIGAYFVTINLYHKPIDNSSIEAEQKTILPKIVEGKTEASGRPVRIKIDKIAVDAPIIPVGVEVSGDMAAPSSLTEVGWYDKSAELGAQTGSVLLDGHYGIGANAAVFRDLGKLMPGDRLVLSDQSGGYATYETEKIENHLLEDVDMERALYYGKDEAQTVVIITCDGIFDPARSTYDRRLVLFAKRV